MPRSILLALPLLLAVTASAETLEERVQTLEDKLEIRPEPAPANPPIDVFFKNGMQAKSRDGNFEIKIGGRVSIHYRQYFIQPERVSSDGFNIKEIKIDLKGKIWKDFGFRVEVDTNGPLVFLDEGWVSFDRFPFARFVVGQYKAPFSIQETQSTLFIDMPERSAIDRLAPGYDLGAMVCGDLVPQALSYSVMVANGTGRAGSDNNSDKDLFVRAQARPFAAGDNAWLKGLHFAADGNMGQRGLGTGVLPYLYSTPPTLTIFVADGPRKNEVRFDQVRYRLGAEFAWMIRSFWLHTEYIWTRDTYRFPGQGPDSGGRAGHANHEAWFVAVGWVITGEDKNWDRPVVAHPLFGGGIGQVEVVGRYCRFWVPGDLMRDGILSKDDSAKRVDEWAICVNWYPNQNVRLSVMYDFVNYDGASTRPVVVNGHRFSHEDVLLVRAQIDF